MKKKQAESGFPPQTEQVRHPVSGVETTPTNAKPRDESFDLVPFPSRTRIAGGTYAYDEDTFKVVKKGNRP